MRTVAKRLYPLRTRKCKNIRSSGGGRSGDRVKEAEEDVRRIIITYKFTDFGVEVEQGLRPVEIYRCLNWSAHLCKSPLYTTRWRCIVGERQHSQKFVFSHKFASSPLSEYFEIKGLSLFRQFVRKGTTEQLYLIKKILSVRLLFKQWKQACVVLVK